MKEIKNSTLYYQMALCQPFEVLAHFTLKIGQKDKKSESFSFLGITFDIIKILTLSFHWGGATLFMLNPGIPNMAIFEVNGMVSINVKSGHKWPFF